MNPIISIKTLKDPNTHSFFLNEITAAEAQKLSNNTNNRTAGDIYGISQKLVKTFIRTY